MKAVLGFLGSAWSGLKDLGAAISETSGSGGWSGAGDEDDEGAGYAGAGHAFSTSSDNEGYATGQVSFLAPAEHNGWGALADFTLPDSNGWDSEDSFSSSDCSGSFSSCGGGMFDD